jgi:enoyl-[acyl-carrier protein] reductase I
MVDLSGRRGLIAGFSGENSFGFSCARAMVEMGAKVTVTSRPQRAEECRRLAESLGCAHLSLDADDERSMDAAFAQLEAVEPRLDFVVHTIMSVPAGVLDRPLLELTRADFEHTLSAGTHSLVSIVRRALPLLLRSPSPRVLTFSFAGSRLMAPNYHVAGICKAALESAVRYLAMELGPKGVLVNALSTSMIPTDVVLRNWGETVAEKTKALLTKRAPTRSAAGLREVTSHAGWLVSGEMTQMTGEVTMVDGGFSKTYV